MIEILRLSSEDEQRLNSHARERLSDWQDRILHEAPQLRGLSIQQTRAHLRTYLHDEELAEFSKCLADITRWLSECMDTGDTYFLEAYAQWVIPPMFRVESLLVMACRRAEEEQRRKEYDDRWRDAFVTMKPPTDDAEKYLNDREQEEFVLALDRAIGAYLEKGPVYLNDIRAMDYVGWLERIQGRKKEEAQRLQAIDEASKYNQRLNQEIRKLTSRLDYEQRDLVDHFGANTQDKRYRHFSLDHVLTEESRMTLDVTLVSAANKRLEKLVSNDLRHFIGFPSRYYRWYFPLPTANYRVDKVPCLDFSFHVFAAVCGEIWLKAGNRSLNGYEFTLPWIKDGGDLVPLKKLRFLGYYHLILPPEDLGGSVSWKCIPLVLLKGLLRGDTRSAGCKVTAASDSVTTYAVPGYDKEVSVQDQFIEYLTSISSIEEMIDMGIMTEKVGGIVKAALADEPAPSGAPLAREHAGRRGSMKERAFRLFDQGRRPSDSEVKALRLKPNSLYRYYQDWKKTRNHS